MKARAADTVARFENDRRLALPRDDVGRGGTSEACANDRDIAVEIAHGLTSALTVKVPLAGFLSSPIQWQTTVCSP